MDKLAGMAAFVRVAEAGSFTAAARRIGLSVSALTKTVTRLERALDTLLIARSTRRLALTDEGRSYLAHCQRILAELDEAETRLRAARERPRGKVRLVVPLLFGRVALLPRLAEFRARYPEIELDVGFRDRAAGAIGEGVDLAVVVGDYRDARLVTRRLADGPRVTAATPDFIAAHGEPRVPDELAGFNCIVGALGPSWPFRVGGRRTEVVVRGWLTVGSGDALREAALLGLGIAQANWWTLREDLAQGRLREILASHAVEGEPISVLHAPARQLPPRMSAVIEFLVEIVDVSPARIPPRGRGRASRAARTRPSAAEH